jgi:hypothetical protein
MAAQFAAMKMINKEEVMKMIRWNLMGLALLALMLNSGLAQADSITNVTPRAVHPGQVVTLHGLFSVQRFRSRQYRIIVSKSIAPRPQGAINGPVNSFNVTSTSIKIQIPRTWRGKPVATGRGRGGEYLLYIRDTVHNRFVVTGGNSPSILVTPSPQDRSPRAIIGRQITRPQQQLLGGNIGRAASPRSPFGRGNIGGGIARGVPQMKLTLRELKVGNRDVSRGVSIGDSVVAWLDIRNLGTAPGQVKVGYMIVGRPYSTTNRFVTVAPGQTAGTFLNVRINARNFDRNINRGAWNPIFSLLTTRNNPYRDSYMADNTVTSHVPLIAKEDLAVVSIEGVKLAESWQGGGEWDYGTTHPVSLEFLVKVKNNTAQNSRPTRLSVTVMGKRSANTDALNDPRVERHSVGRCAHWPICTMNQDVSIAAIAAGQTGTFRVRFGNIPHQIVQSRRHHVRVAVGPYICARHWVGGSVIPGSASIIAFLRQADVDEAPSFRANNHLTLTGKFGSGMTCGMENTRVTRNR